MDTAISSLKTMSAQQAAIGTRTWLSIFITEDRNYKTGLPLRIGHFKIAHNIQTPSVVQTLFKSKGNQKNTALEKVGFAENMGEVGSEIPRERNQAPLAWWRTWPELP